MSEQTQKGHLVVISGPSGVGKGTLIQQVQKLREGVEFSVSCTTRQPRPGEVHGVHYYFLTPAEFEQMVQEDGFLEHAGYADKAYGTGRAQMEEKLARSGEVILDIEVQGALQVKQRCPEATLIYILPPSFEELAHRLIHRGTEDRDTVRKRLSRAIEESRFISEYDYIVVNDDLEEAARQLIRIFDAIGSRGVNMQPAVNDYCTSMPENVEKLL